MNSPQVSSEQGFDPYGVIRNADDLRAILRARFQELGVSFETVDHVAGLPTRYTSKVLGFQATRGFGQISLDALLGAAGVMLIAVADPEALERIRNRLVPLERIDTSGGPRRRVKFNFSLRFMSEIGKAGARKRMQLHLEKQRRSAIYRANARKRWDKAAGMASLGST